MADYNAPGGKTDQDAVGGGFKSNTGLRGLLKAFGKKTRKLNILEDGKKITIEVPIDDPREDAW